MKGKLTDSGKKTVVSRLGTEEKTRKEKRSERWKTFGTGVSKVGSSSFDVFKLVFLILIISLLFSSLIGTETKTFGGFLEYLRTAPTISKEIVSWKPVTLGDWGVFNWLRNFFVQFSGFFSRLALIGGSFLDAISLVLWFFTWLLF